MSKLVLEISPPLIGPRDLCVCQICSNTDVIGLVLSVDLFAPLYGTSMFLIISCLIGDVAGLSVPFPIAELHISMPCEA